MKSTKKIFFKKNHNKISITRKGKGKNKAKHCNP